MERQEVSNDNRYHSDMLYVNVEYTWVQIGMFNAITGKWFQSTNTFDEYTLDNLGNVCWIANHYNLIAATLR